MDLVRNFCVHTTLSSMKVRSITLTQYTPKIPVAVNCRPKTSAFDSVSFSSNGKKLAKSDLSGFDYFCNELFKFPLEKMSSMEDFSAMAREEVKKCLGAEYAAKMDRGDSIKNTRTKELKEWEKYLTQESPTCTKKPSIALVIAKGLTRNLKKSNKSLPTILNKGILEGTIKELDDRLSADKKVSFNFMEQYCTNLKAHYLEKAKQEDFVDSDGDGFWVRITSEPEIDTGGQKPGESDEDYDKRIDEIFDRLFEENVKKLRVLSHPNWCTSSYMAEEYLRQGDFHIFIENGQPKFAIRFEDNKIAEIEEPQNNGKVQKDSAVALDRYIAKNRYNYKSSSNVNEDFIKYGAQLVELAKNKDYFGILDCLGFEPEILDSGKFAINGYNKAFFDNNLEDFGIDENELFENIELVKGDVDLNYTKLENLGAVKEIHGDLNCKNSNLRNLGELKLVKGSLDLTGSTIERLRYLQRVGGDLILRNSEVKWFDHLKEVGGNLDLVDSAFASVGRHKIKKKDGSVVILPKFEKLEKVGGQIFMKSSDYTDDMDKDIWNRNGLNIPKFA